jgi:pimeloyl-ACP methyl ester carboxylesterase
MISSGRLRLVAKWRRWCLATRFEVMEDAGHFPHLQAPETLVRLARDFLDG